jgi:hypothetical protein
VDLRLFTLVNPPLHLSSVIDLARLEVKASVLEAVSHDFNREERKRSGRVMSMETIVHLFPLTIVSRDNSSYSFPLDSIKIESVSILTHTSFMWSPMDSEHRVLHIK